MTVQEMLDEVIALIENTPSPGEADETESGFRYAQGYRDASRCAAEELAKLAKAVRALADDAE